MCHVPSAYSGFSGVSSMFASLTMTCRPRSRNSSLRLTGCGERLVPTLGGGLNSPGSGNFNLFSRHSSNRSSNACQSSFLHSFHPSGLGLDPSSLSYSTSQYWILFRGPNPGFSGVRVMFHSGIARAMICWMMSYRPRCRTGCRLLMYDAM